MSDWTEVNRANWDERVPAHVASPDYAVERFYEDPSFLSQVVAFDRPSLGDIAGLTGVHLQCHIGTDTVSLSRLGASMTGFDFSAPAVAAATALAEGTGADATFVQGLVDEAPALLGKGRFDFLYTGIGALCWLPRIDDWARVVDALLRHGHDVPGHHLGQLEPRAGGDHHVPADQGLHPDRAGRARVGAVGRPARPDGEGR